MFVRVFFFLLLALNLGALGWQFLFPRQPEAAIAATDAGVPKLILLSETEQDPAAHVMPAQAVASPARTNDELPVGTAEPGVESCASLGPFMTQTDMRTAMKLLTPLVGRIQYRQSHISEPRGFWVYLPAPGNRERALAVARDLSGKGVSDYYVVTAGDQSNAISLGLFRDPANAEKRRSEIAALGFAPLLTQRSDEAPVYFIDYAQAAAQALDWRSHLPAQMDVHSAPTACF